MAKADSLDLRFVREELGFSQAELAALLGVSPRTVQSSEQGWRNPSAAVEKSALLLLLAKRHGAAFSAHRCWETMGCSEEERRECLAFLTHQGHLCWLLSGNVCHGKRLTCWEEKKIACMKCRFFRELLPDGLPTRASARRPIRTEREPTEAR